MMGYNAPHNAVRESVNVHEHTDDDQSTPDTSYTNGTWLHWNGYTPMQWLLTHRNKSHGKTVHDDISVTEQSRVRNWCHIWDTATVEPWLHMMNHKLHQAMGFGRYLWMKSCATEATHRIMLLSRTRDRKRQQQTRELLTYLFWA